MSKIRFREFSDVKIHFLSDAHEMTVARLDWKTFQEQKRNDLENFNIFQKSVGHLQKNPSNTRI